MAAPHAFNLILVVNTRTNNFPVLLLVSGDCAAGTISIAKFCFVTQESLNHKSYDFLIWVKYEPLRLGVPFGYLAKLFSVQCSRPP